MRKPIGTPWKQHKPNGLFVRGFCFPFLLLVPLLFRLLLPLFHVVGCQLPQRQTQPEPEPEPQKQSSSVFNKRTTSNHHHHHRYSLADPPLQGSVILYLDNNKEYHPHPHPHQQEQQENGLQSNNQWKLNIISTKTTHKLQEVEHNDNDNHNHDHKRNFMPNIRATSNGSTLTSSSPSLPHSHSNLISTSASPQSSGGPNNETTSSKTTSNLTTTTTITTTSTTINATVPGDLLTDLVAAKVLKEPYFDNNFQTTFFCHEQESSIDIDNGNDKGNNDDKDNNDDNNKDRDETRRFQTKNDHQETTTTTTSFEYSIEFETPSIFDFPSHNDNSETNYDGNDCDGDDSGCHNSNGIDSQRSKQGTNDEILLVFDGIKMGARIILNDHILGTITDQFLRYSYPIQDLLLPNTPKRAANTLHRRDDRHHDHSTGAMENHTTTEFHDTTESHDAATSKTSMNKLTIVLDSNILTDGRFAACSGGWDWAPFSTCPLTPDTHSHSFTKGITKSVYLTRVAPVAITAIVPHTFYRGGKRTANHTYKQYEAHPTEALIDGKHAGFDVNITVHLWSPPQTRKVFMFANTDDFTT